MRHDPTGWRRWSRRAAMACADALARARCLIDGGELIRDSDEDDEGRVIDAGPALYPLATVPGWRVDVWARRDDLDGAECVCLDAFGWRVEAWRRQRVRRPALQ